MLGLTAQEQKGGYIPTQEELNNIKMKPGYFKLSGDGIFHTLQGEGDLAGRPTTFIRLHHCNLQCERCDAWYTWKNDTKEFYEEPYDVIQDELMIEVFKAQKKYGIKEPIKNITFTGGEPMMQQREIEKFMKDNPDYFIQIETNGTIPPLTEYLLKSAKYNCSPKLSMSNNDLKRRLSVNTLKKLNTKHDTIFKFVFRIVADIDEVLENYKFLDRNKIRFMPEGVTKEENAIVFQNTIDYILTTGCNVAIRCQNVMRDGALRGV